MIEKIGTIKNPLTIIAIFAGIAEISGTGVLIFISDTDNQRLFIWFVMIFPILLICLFFFTLYFNHKVLYAPSDFKEEKHFFIKSDSLSNYDELQKLKEATTLEEIKITEAHPEVDRIFNSQNIERSPTAENDPTLRIRANYLLAEKLAIMKIRQELKGDLIRHVNLQTKEGKKIILDGLVRNKEETTIIEVEFIPDLNLNSQGLINSFTKVLDLFASIDSEITENAKYLIVIVSEVTIKNLESFSTQLQSMIKHSPLPIELKMYNLSELNKHFNS